MYEGFSRGKLMLFYDLVVDTVKYFTAIGADFNGSFSEGCSYVYGDDEDLDVLDVRVLKDEENCGQWSLSLGTEGCLNEHLDVVEDYKVYLKEKGYSNELLELLEFEFEDGEYPEAWCLVRLEDLPFKGNDSYIDNLYSSADLCSIDKVEKIIIYILKSLCKRKGIIDNEGDMVKSVSRVYADDFIPSNVAMFSLLCDSVETANKIKLAWGDIVENLENTHINKELFKDIFNFNGNIVKNQKSHYCFLNSDSFDNKEDCYLLSGFVKCSTSRVW